MANKKDILEDEILPEEKTVEDAVEESNAFYDTAISEYQGAIDAQKATAEQWGQAQKEAQQAQTDLAIQQIEQNKEQAEKDFKKESSAAYKDYQNQINPYGANAERMASMGMTNTGYSESSKVAMYNTHQNRVALAKQSLDQANMMFENQIQQAINTNNYALAEIAFKTFEEMNALTLSSIMQTNLLKEEKFNRERNIRSSWQSVLDQLETAGNDLIVKDEDNKDNDLPVKDEGTKGEETDGNGHNTPTLIEGDIAPTPTVGGTPFPSYSASNALGGNYYKPPQPTVDMESVKALGLGDLTEEELSDLVNKGIVTMKLKDGKYVFEKNMSTQGAKLPRNTTAQFK